MDEEGQKFKVGYCSDRYTENRDKQRNFVLNPSLHWKPVECSEQCCCTCMPRLTEDKSGCMILYGLKFIQFFCQGYQQEESYTSLS